jgi:hypothetical protein
MKIIDKGDNKILITNSGELLDILPFLPSTELNEKMNNQASELSEPKSSDEIDRRLFGMKKYILMTTYEGSRNTNMFKFAKFCVDFNLDVESELSGVNSMLTEPLSSRELNKIIRSAQR